MKSVQTLLAIAPRKRLLAVAIASSLTATAAVAQQVVVDDNLVVSPVLNQRVIEKTPRTKLQIAAPTNYIIQLEDPSAIMYHGGKQGLQGTSTQATGTEKFVTDSVAAKSYSDYLVNQQRQVFSVMQSRFPNMELARHLTLTMNGIIVSVPGKVDIKEQLQAIPGVKRVWEEEFHYVSMDASLDLINVEGVWQTLGGRDAAGAGIKVAVVDTGINEEHPMFQSAGASPVAGQLDDYCGVTDATFCNDKIIAARSYMTEAAVAGAAVGETIGPKDFNGHGSHVAGTSVGKIITTDIGGVATTLSGVAPGAYLMAYKACYQVPSGQGTCPSTMTIAALEDAVADGADVINNSWGGGAGSAPENSVHKPVIEALNEAGVLAVFSAGNNGPGAQTIGCPSCVEEALTVASTQTGRVFEGSIVTAGNTFVSYEGSTTTIAAPLELELTAAVVADDTNALACNAFAPGTFNGEAVFTQRGTCSFETKANNIAAAGGGAMILANNTTGIIIMSMGSATLPSVSISQADGNTLLTNWTAGDMVTLNPERAKIYPENTDKISGFSSRGPNGNSSFLKPEIAAPGSDILSASPAGSALRLLSGTSMAAPHVAGAAALMKQIHGVNSDQLKSILMTSAVAGVKADDGVTEANPFIVGAGKLNVGGGAATVVTVDKANLTNNSCAISCTFERTITDISGAVSNWSVAVSFDDPALTATASASAVTIPANGSATLSLTIDSRWASQGWKFGTLTLTPATAGVAPVRLPIAIVASRSEDVTIVSVAQTAGSTTVGEGYVQTARGSLGTLEGRDVTVTINVPEGTDLNVDSVSVTNTLATEVSGELSADGRTLTYVATQTNDPDTASMTDVSATFPFTGFGLAANGFGSVLCNASSCDEQVYTFNLGATGGVLVDGRMVSTLTLGINGLNAIDNQASAFSNTWYNEDMPNASPPNGVFAPMWADLVINPANGGEIRYAALTDGSGQPWFVWEWVNAEIFDDTSGAQYTFAIWYKRGTGEVYYNYIDMGAAPQFATVGVEGSDGSFGTRVFFDGEGTFPVSNSAWLASANKGAKASSAIEYTLDIPFLGTSGNRSLTMFRNSAGSSVDLTAETEVGFDILNLVTVSAGDESYSAINPASVTATGAVSIALVDMPANGTATVEGNVVSYVPDQGFTGSDSFTYHAVDEAGATTDAGTINVAVNNRAPVARITGSPVALVQPGQNIALSGSTSSDADGDGLTYSWIRLSGPAINLSTPTAVSTGFTVPADAEGAVFTIQLTVSDGVSTSTDQVSIQVEEDSGGSFAFWLALLGLPAALLRRRRLM